MFFHIDESGNTGNNLFDKNQPVLSYGVLSSNLNVDALGQKYHNKMLRELDTNSLHANILGVDKLSKITPLLLELQKHINFRFDYYDIDKISYALVIFFDAVFDAGINPAVKWDLYWTPLRFPFIYKLSSLFDEELLQESWNLCISKNITPQSDRIINLLQTLTTRAENSTLDDRAKELIIDAFKYGIKHPLELDFGFSDQKLISPNSVCFQFVVYAMAMRIKKARRKDATSIIVDRQFQFNSAQSQTHYIQQKLTDGYRKADKKDQNSLLFHPLYRDLNKDMIMGKGMPKQKIQNMNSEDSIGLQIVDIYLWITNRLISGKELSPELTYLGSKFLTRSYRDGISMDHMMERWNRIERQLPQYDELKDNEIKFVQKGIDDHRATVKKLDL